MLPMNANRCSWTHLALPKKTNGLRQVHLVPPAKAYGHSQLRVAQPMSASSRHQLQEAPAQKWKAKGVNVLSVEKMELLLPIPLQASARKSMAK
jgi:hypothetical protein